MEDGKQKGASKSQKEHEVVDMVAVHSLPLGAYPIDTR